MTPLGLRGLKATTGRNGLVELATEAEAKAGTDKERVVTPAGLKAVVDEATPDASEAAKGMIQIASTVEATAGTDALKAMTPRLERLHSMRELRQLRGRKLARR